MKRKTHSLLTILLLACASVSAQTPRAWIINPNFNDSFSGFEVMDKAAQSGRFFLGGEDHRYMEFNSRMELKLMRYLHQKGGVRHMILELGFARGYVLQQYVQTGDSVWLDLLEHTTGSDYMEMYRSMREWNRALPDADKVIVTGIDVERYTDVPLLLLDHLLPDSGIPDALLVHVEAIKGLAKFIYNEGASEDEGAEDGVSEEGSDVSSDNYEIIPTLRTFITQYDSLKPMYRKYLGRNFGLTDTLLNSLRQYLIWDDYEYTPYQYTYREKVMYDNMKALLQRYPNGKFYGQFGRCHAGTAVQNGPCGWLNYHSIAQKMTTLMPEPFRNHVVTVGYFYSDGEEDDDAEDDDWRKPSAQERETESFEQETPEGSVALFSLDSLQQAYPTLANRYDFVLFYNNAETSYDEDDYESELDEYDVEFTHFGYVYHREWGKTARLNQALNALGLPSVNNNLVMQGFDVAYFPRKYADETGGRLSVLWLPTQSLRFGAQADSFMRFNMFRVMSETCKDVLRSKHFNLALGTGLGYGLSRLELKAADKTVDFRNPQPTARVLYRNPAFWLSLCANARVALGPVSLGISGGIGRDVSRSAWRFEGKRISGTPSFAQHMKYLEATIGFVIKD